MPPCIRTLCVSGVHCPLMGSAGRRLIAKAHCEYWVKSGFCWPWSDLSCHHCVIARAISGWVLLAPSSLSHYCPHSGEQKRLAHESDSKRHT